MASQSTPLVVEVNVSWQSLVPQSREQHLRYDQEILPQPQVLLRLPVQPQLWRSGLRKLILDITLFLRKPQPGLGGVTGQGGLQMKA